MGRASRRASVSRLTTASSASATRCAMSLWISKMSLVDSVLSYRSAHICSVVAPFSSRTLILMRSADR